MNKFLTPETMALIAGGLSTMQASQGGNTDMTKQGLGYVLNQGLKSGLEGAKIGQQFQDASAARNAATQKSQTIESYFNSLPPEKQGQARMLYMADPKSFAKSLGIDSPFKDLNENLKAMQATRKAADTSMAPSNESLRKYAQATDMVRKKNGFDKLSGADDTVLMKGFASMILPGEAVMSDDINIIAQQDGVPGWFKSYAAQLKGSGQLSAEQRADIYQTMTTLAERANAENQQYRKQFAIDKKLGDFPEGSIFREEIGFNPFVPPKTDPTQKTPTATKIIGDKKYILVNGSWEEA